MRLIWTNEAVSDLVRLREFLEPLSPDAAARTIQSLSIAPERLLDQPRVGARVMADEGEIRRLIVGHYELRYEIRDEVIYILRIWRGREDR